MSILIGIDEACLFELLLARGQVLESRDRGTLIGGSPPSSPEANPWKDERSEAYEKEDQEQQSPPAQGAALGQ